MLFFQVLAESSPAAPVPGDKGGISSDRAVGAVTVETLAEDGTSSTSLDLYRSSAALVLGVSEYRLWPDIGGAREDANAIAALLQQHGFKVTKVIDPTGDEIAAAVDAFIREHGIDARNRLVIYFAGHGYTEKLSDGREVGYIVGSDAGLPGDQDRKTFRRGTIMMDRFQFWSREIESYHVLFVFDSCFSGTIFRTRAAPVPPAYIRREIARPIRYFITSGSAFETVPDISIFRREFARGIEGAADRGRKDGYVTTTELASYLLESVPALTDHRQNPQVGPLFDDAFDDGDLVFVPTSSEDGIPRLVVPKATEGSGGRDPRFYKLLGEIEAGIKQLEDADR